MVLQAVTRTDSTTRNRCRAGRHLERDRVALGLDDDATHRRGRPRLAAHGFRRFVLTDYQADPDHLRAIAAARRRLRRDGRAQVLVAGFTPADGRPSVMTDPRVRALMRSPRPEREWHSGELETAMMLSVAPALVRCAHRPGGA
jgi:hypothetical protein